MNLLFVCVCVCIYMCSFRVILKYIVLYGICESNNHHLFFNDGLTVSPQNSTRVKFWITPISRDFEIPLREQQVLTELPMKSAVNDFFSSLQYIFKKFNICQILVIICPKNTRLLYAKSGGTIGLPYSFWNEQKY